MTCIHCEGEFQKKDIFSKIVYTYGKYSVIDYFCPDCEKIMNGCSEIQVAGKSKNIYIPKIKYKHWTKKNTEYIREWYRKKYVKEIAKDLGRTIKATEMQIRRMKKKKELDK